QASSSLSSSQSAAISAGPAVALDMSSSLTTYFQGSVVTTAGQPSNVGLRAIDAYGNTATDYTGTVKLTSSDDRTTLPGLGSGVVQFSAGDAGTMTLTGIAFFTKRIYDQRASLTAADTGNSQIIGSSLTYQVLPGPAVTYSCPQPRSRESYWQHVIDPVGVNDELILLFRALDAYGNDATNREPAFSFNYLPR